MAKKTSLAKSYIIQAFLTLLGEKAYDEISIKGITEKAGVSRTTFYRLYQNKEEILNEIKDSSTKSLYQGIYNILSSDNSYEEIKKTLKSIYENKRIVTLLFTAKAINYEILTYNINADDFIKTSSYTDYARVSIVVTSLYKWIINDMKDDIDKTSLELSNILNKIK